MSPDGTGAEAELGERCCLTSGEDMGSYEKHPSLLQSGIS
jgi:hypothetical protein